jgi:hypothetical protein
VVFLELESVPSTVEEPTLFDSHLLLSISSLLQFSLNDLAPTKHQPVDPYAKESKSLHIHFVCYFSQTFYNSKKMTLIFRDLLLFDYIDTQPVVSLDNLKNNELAIQSISFLTQEEYQGMYQFFFSL